MIGCPHPLPPFARSVARAHALAASLARLLAHTRRCFRHRCRPSKRLTNTQPPPLASCAGASCAGAGYQGSSRLNPFTLMFRLSLARAGASCAGAGHQGVRRDGGPRPHRLPQRLHPPALRRRRRCRRRRLRCRWVVVEQGGRDQVAGCLEQGGRDQVVGCLELLPGILLGAARNPSWQGHCLHF